MTSALQKRYPKAKVIPVESNPRAIILKTTNEEAPSVRYPESKARVGGKTLTAVLTSGGVGKLKRRAAEARDHGQVP